MIPHEGRTLIELHMGIARSTEHDGNAEEHLNTVCAMLGYALAVNHLSPAEYSNELVLIELIRAQRKNRSAAELPKTYTSFSDGVRAVKVTP